LGVKIFFVQIQKEKQVEMNFYTNWNN